METTRIKDAIARRIAANVRVEWYILEHDVAADQTGIVITYPGSEVGVQNGLTPSEFLALYPEFTGTLPSEPCVISFLEFASIDDFEANRLEKAYVIYTEETAFEGITGYPISAKEDMQGNTQIAIPATAANLAKIPAEVLQQIPQTDALAYVRYNDDFSRVSYEVEYEVTSLDSTPDIAGVAPEVLHQYIMNVREMIGIDKVQMIAKYTVGQDVPKLYFALSYCKDCQD